jgi:hypothetical protein
MKSSSPVILACYQKKFQSKANILEQIVNLGHWLNDQTSSSAP